MSAKVARHFVIRGEVQGVGYRFFVQRAAAHHQVVGYVKNMPDGSVESLAEGFPEDLENFKHDLVVGPRFAKVERVEEKVIEPTGTYVAFRVER